MTAPPLTLGTAGHVDHGKTALVRRLTGVDTDRLPEERARGLSIALGYAPLRLPSGRRLSVVDVPGHERFVRTMVAGATGVDLALLVVAADDGPMPQTHEHVAVLRALGVAHAVVAVTKADRADAADAAAAAGEAWPGAEVVACSAVTGEGVADVAAALDRVVVRLPGRTAAAPGPAVLHVDRAFVVHGRGVVATGTLWSGALAEGDTVAVLPGGARARVRGLHVHDAPVARAEAGGRVAVNLAGVRHGEVRRGDVLATPGAVVERRVLDAALVVPRARHGERVQVHHGTRDVPGRLAHLADDLWQVRLEAPLAARDGDRVVVRRVAPPDTLGGGVVLDAAAGRHGRRAEILARLRARRDGRPAPPVRPPAPVDPPVPRVRIDPSGLEVRLREAGARLLAEAEAGDRDALRALREAGTAVRVGGRLYAHADVVAEVRARVEALVARDGGVTLAALRDDLGVGRRAAQAFLEHLDAARVTRRLPDDRRILAA